MLDLYIMGERIRKAREDLGYTREQFSERANITPRFCYDIEAGKKGVSIDTFKNICEALNLSADHLLDLKPMDPEVYDYTIFHALMEECPDAYRESMFMSSYRISSLESRMMVNGPSFRSSTFISAPKLPVSTTGSCFLHSAMIYSYSSLAF